MKIAARPLIDADVSLRVDWFNSPLVHSQMTIRVPLTVEATSQWLARVSANVARFDVAFFDPEDRYRAPVAMGGIVNISSEHKNGELYVVVAPSLIGKGIGTKAVQWLTNYGFGNLHLWKVFLHTLASNALARSLYERIGFVHEGVLREHVCHDGKMVDRHVQGMLRPEWQNMAWSAEAELTESEGAQ